MDVDSGGLFSNLFDRYDRIDSQLLKVLTFHTESSINPRECDLFEKIQQCVSGCKEPGRIVLEKKCPNSTAVVDWELIQLSVDNLIDNAIKFTEQVPGAEKIMIDFYSNGVKNRDEEVYTIRVRDFGFGIRDDEIERVTLPNVMGTESIKGLASFGIGLAEADKVARLHRNHSVSGKLEIKNAQKGRGCIAELSIPRSADLS